MRQSHTPEVALQPSLLPLHASEIKLLALMRKLGHGSLEIQVQDGYPVLVEKLKQKIRLV